MRITYSVDCHICGAEHAFRGCSELPNDAVCHKCDATLLSTGKIEYWQLCEYCAHENYFSYNPDVPMCECCGFKLPDIDSDKEENNVVGISKFIVAGFKTGDKDTIITIILMLIGVAIMFSLPW